MNLMVGSVPWKKTGERIFGRVISFDVNSYLAPMPKIAFIVHIECELSNPIKVASFLGGS